MAVKFNSVIVTIVILVSAVGGVKGTYYDVADNFTFGDCEPGKESCTECYLTLVKSLFRNGTNVFNLIDVFSPPNFNPPDHVIVTYHYHNDDGSNCSAATWFWATTFGYFLHQPIHFQFISLLFGKPEPLYEQTVEVTLPADCCEVEDKFMQLLTQRLKAYVQEQSITAHVDDSYAASATNDDSFNDTIRTYGKDTDYLAVYLSITYPVIIPICMLGIIVQLMALYVCVRKHRYSQTGEKKHTRLQKLTRRFRAGIISFAIISFVRLVMIVGTDVAAVYYTEEPTEVEIEEIHDDNISYYHSILYHIPHALLVLDGLISATYIAIVTVVVVSYFCAKSSNDQDDEYRREDKTYYTLGLTVVCPILSFFMHLPFIAIAYLNDANYAGSIFSFYIVVTILEFLILEFTFISYFRLPKASFRDQLTKTLLTALVVVLCLSFLYIFIVISICFFYYLPIVQSLSRSSNQIIVIYQTGLIFLGAGVMYTTVFRKTTPLIKALKQKEIGDMVSKSGIEEWEASSDQQKLADFYSFMITDVIRNLSRAPVIKGGVLDTDGQIEREAEKTPSVAEPTTIGTSENDDEPTMID